MRDQSNLKLLYPVKSRYSEKLYGNYEAVAPRSSAISDQRSLMKKCAIKIRAKAWLMLVKRMKIS